MAIGKHINDVLRSQGQGAFDFVPGGVISSPGAGAVLVDSGALGGDGNSAWLVQVLAWSDTATSYDVERRNAANDAVVTHSNGNPIEQRFALAANASDLPTYGAKMLAFNGERVRVTLNGASPTNCMFSLSILEVQRTA